MTPGFKHIELYGGAITVNLPAGYGDVRSVLNCSCSRGLFKVRCPSYDVQFYLRLVMVVTVFYLVSRVTFSTRRNIKHCSYASFEPLGPSEIPLSGISLPWPLSIWLTPFHSVATSVKFPTTKKYTSTRMASAPLSSNSPKGSRIHPQIKQR